MAYVTVQDIRDTIPQVQITDSSRPNLNEVTTLITMYETTLDGVLKSLGYTTPLDPVASPLSTLLARDMIKKVVAAEVLRSQLAGVRDADTLGAKAWEQSWDVRIKRLGDPSDPFTFPDAVQLTAESKLNVIATSMVSEDPDFLEEARITREQVF